MTPHTHNWTTCPDDGAPWEICTGWNCDARRHRPVRNGHATVCPGVRTGEHQWQPVSFTFETQELGPQGQVLLRQPNIDRGRVYVVCMACRSHSYVETAWVGYMLGHPFMEEEQAHYDGGAW